MKVTDAAYKQIAKIGSQLYLSLELGGCEEYKYRFSLNQFELEAQVYVFHEVRILIPKDQVEQLGEIELDFESNLVRSGFIIKHNPSVKEKCRCGISFR